MVMFLKHMRRKGRSSKIGGTLRCPACDIEEKHAYTGVIQKKRPKLKFLHTVGDNQDVYECLKCHRLVRHVITPHDPIGRGMNRKETIADCHVGMHHKEVARLEKVKRAKKRGIKYLPGLGRIPGRSRPKPKD